MAKSSPYPDRVKKAANGRLMKSLAIATESGMLPQEFLLAVMRGEPVKHIDEVAHEDGTLELVERDVRVDFETRLTIARDLLPYYAPKLVSQQVDITASASVDFTTRPASELTDDQLAAIIEAQTALPPKGKR